jgi:hypothetical protein
MLRQAAAASSLVVVLITSSFPEIKRIRAIRKPHHFCGYIINNEKERNVASYQRESASLPIAQIGFADAEKTKGAEAPRVIRGFRRCWR